MIQSDFGRVEVNAVKVDTQKGQHLVFDLYRPISATQDNKAPFVVVVPGFQRSKEALSNIAIELSRRGWLLPLLIHMRKAFQAPQEANVRQLQKVTVCSF
jgi:D-lyxose ketol-isomerase